MKIEKRIQDAANTLYLQAYEAEYGGKTRGKFQMSREDLIRLLGVPRLHPEDVRQLTDACLATNLAVVDMDTKFIFLETNFVDKFRKLPTRLVNEYAAELDNGVVEEIADDLADLEADED
jgi:hypothetical protein